MMIFLRNIKIQDNKSISMYKGIFYCFFSALSDEVICIIFCYCWTSENYALTLKLSLTSMLSN